MIGTPLACPQGVLNCGTMFTMEHALSCPKGGSPSMWHNEIRDLTAIFLSKVCHDDLCWTRPAAKERCCHMHHQNTRWGPPGHFCQWLLGWMIWENIFGCESSIYIIPFLIRKHRSLLVTESKRMQRTVHKSNMSEKSYFPLLLPWFSLLKWYGQWCFLFSCLSFCGKCDQS